ncbi:hypothetical protein RND81_07G156800 [Saponaria officinalis]|uniref:Succinate dehydrogenase subunit 5, mitochondrial n=1 Tax=Saponaria officinalis TaxID=3572 RepID=A0AAW1JNT3_SAPOF
MAMLMRSVYRSYSSTIRSSVYSIVLGDRFIHATLSHQQQQQPLSSHSFFTLSSSPTFFPNFPVGSTRAFSQGFSQYPDIKDPSIKNVFKGFMAVDWGELPEVTINAALKVLSKDTDDTIGKETLKNVFRAAEAVEEFIGQLESLKMAIDDHAGLSGENAKPYPEHYGQALRTAYDRYTKYLDSFGPDEFYLKKKVETELGTRMIHLKMRCSHLGSEWGKVTVLGTSGISGSYVEQRAP